MAMEQSPRDRTGLMIAVLVILGLVAGLALGLLLGWVVWPVEFVDTSISDLAPEYKDEYVLLVASAYLADGNVEKAQARLAHLEVPNINGWLSAEIDSFIAAGRDEADIRVLAALAHALGVTSPQMLAYVATDTPVPTETPVPTPTPLPTDTPTSTPTSTDTPLPTDTPEPTETAVPPTDTPKPTPTNTPKPAAPTNTPRPPAPTKTPTPTSPPADPWTWSARLVGPGEDAQACQSGLLQIRVTVVDANGVQIPNMWIYDKYSGQYQLTGNVDSSDWGPGETRFEYGIGGGGSLCIADGQGGGCVTGFTRDMPCYWLPPIEDLYAAGYCECCEPGITIDRCRQLVEGGSCFGTGAGHFSWRVVYQRGW